MKDQNEKIVTLEDVGTYGHTPEPWHVGQHEGRYIYDEGGLGIAIVTDSGRDLPNARRIVACVNACAGIPTEWIENKAALPLAELKAEVDAELTALREQVADLRAALYRSDRALYRRFTSDGIGRAEADRILRDNAAVLAATQPQEVQS